MGTVTENRRESDMMSLEECYDALGGNYKAVLGRLSSERIVKKFVLKFLNDQSYVLLEQS